MRSTVSTRSSRATERNAGFSIVELMTVMLLSGVLLSLVARDFGFSVGTRHDLDLVVEAQHALRTTLSEITQELRQVGACLPTTGEFLALNGTEGGPTDRLVLRIGQVDESNVVCSRTILTADAKAGTSVLEVEDGAQFSSDQLIYLAGNTGSGKIFKASSASGTTLRIEGGLDRDYLAGDGVYALEERVYEVDDSSGDPVLTVAIDGGEPQPLVDGVERFDVHYMQEPCPPCDAVDAPTDDDGWRRVREVAVEVGVVSREPRRAGELVTLTGGTNIRPRNLF